MSAPSAHPPATSIQWNERYATDNLPWDSRLPSRELVAAIDRRRVRPCRTLELGCGTGTNAIYLAQQGFDVVAVDLAEEAIKQAQSYATAARVDVQFRPCDVADLPSDWGPFEFVFDRGCYHCARREALAGYLAALERTTAPGCQLLILAGNADETTEEAGPPRVTAAELTAELEPSFRVESLRVFRFTDRGGAPGPLGWAAWFTRRS